MKLSAMVMSFFILLLSASCGGGSGTSGSGSSSAVTMSEQINQEIAEKIVIKDSSSRLEWKNEYTYALAETLSDPFFSALYTIEINEADLKEVKCTNFNQLSDVQKQTFYIVFFAAIAEAESDFRTELKYLKNIGMLQIDEISARRHTNGKMGSLDEEALKDGETNLKVGVFILRNQLKSKIASKRLFTNGEPYYWEVLKTKKRVLKNIALNYSNISFCSNQ